MNEEENTQLKAWYARIASDLRAAMGREDERPILVAVDGPCASGKTTLADMLAREFDCNLFHMDDFFLRPEQRTPERLLEVGGNVDYERFRDEVLTPVLERRPFSYRVYDCGLQRLTDVVEVPVKRINLVEGSYSRHPYFGSCYSLAYCLSVGEEEQRRRILARNGPAMLKRFEEEWIPKENAYFSKFNIRE